MLIADRFLVLDGRTIDLASGRFVDVRERPVADGADYTDWCERCAALSSPYRARDVDPQGVARRRLVDFGLLPDGRRFEAYCVRPEGCGAGEARPMRRSEKACRKGAFRSHAAWNDTAFDALLGQLTDAFDSGCLGEPRCIRVGAHGRFPPAALDAVARQARLRGFVPVSAGLVIRAAARASHGRASAGFDCRSRTIDEVLAIVRGRHLLLLATEPAACPRDARIAVDGPHGDAVCPGALARLVVTIGAQNARPNVLFLAATGFPAVRRCAAVCSVGWRPVSGTRAGGTQNRAAARRPIMPVAAEAHETYAVSASDLVRLHSRVLDAFASAERGRYRRAEYALRDLGGALARRGDTRGAAWTVLNLGCLLLERGRALEAARSFESGRAYFDRGEDADGAVRATHYIGIAWTDDGRLPEAEAAFRTARIAAQEAGCAERESEATVGLARCLYWQGRFDEATVLVSALLDRTVADDARALHGTVYDDQHTKPLPAVVREAQPMRAWGEHEPPPTVGRHNISIPGPCAEVHLASLATRLALARGDLRLAAEHAARAADGARRSGRATDICVAHTALAAVHGSLHDSDALVADVQRALVAARRAHSPLRALRIRLLAADALRQNGREADARPLLRRLGRLDAARLPGLLRARLQIVLAAESGRAACGRAASPMPGAHAALVVPACPWRPVVKPRDVVEDIISVVQCCSDVEDEQAALARVCEVVREQTRALAVGLAGREDGAAPGVVARAGVGSGQPAIAERVLDSGLAVSATATANGLEAAAPITYAGTVVGVLYGRWAADAIVNEGRLSGLFSAVAAATAPLVRSLLDREHAPACGPAADEPDLIGVSQPIELLRKATRRAAAAPFPVLIEGESGSGKELVARAIHRHSARRGRRFCALNCAALTDELLEAEMFGHARGAFTGAVSDRVGLFEEADGGTLFLDEVADLSARAQAKLLRALQEGEVRRLGENLLRRVDVRVVAATNRDLESEVGRGSFRRDLFYRLNVVHIDVPPLRDRREDIPALAAHFWQRAVARTGSRATLAPATLAALARHDWPGNVRELQNVMAALAVSAPRRGSVGPACLPAAIGRVEATDARGASLDAARRVFERGFVRAALARAGWHRGQAAKSLGLSRQGLAKLMDRLGVAGRE